MTRDAIPPGTVLANRYEVGELLGLGGFGATYRAVDQARFRAPCVVKELLPSRRDNETARRLFEREARLLASIVHPQIPALHAYFEEAGRFYLVQEYIEGRTLKELLEASTRLPEVDVRRLVEQVLTVLTYLHGLEPPLIHRDIKPANIILSTQGTAYLIDFGAVREVIGADDNQTAIGTAGYTPREQAVGRPRPSSDLYALGATALEMISGEHPLEWHDRNTGELQWKGRINCSPSFERFLEGSLAAPAQRFPTATEALHALLTLDAPATADTASVSPAPTASAENSTARPWRPFAAILVALALTVGALWSFSSRSPFAATVPPAQSGGSSPTPAATDTQVPSPAAVSRGPATSQDTLAPSRSTPADPQKATRPAAAATTSESSTPDSVSQDCARLLERVSLGETLTSAEMSRLRSRCG